MNLDPANSFTRADLFGGTGAVRIWNLLPAAPAPPFTAALWCALAPGGDVGRHLQQAFPEIVLCVAGVGEAGVDDTVHPLSPGAMVYLPLGSILSLRNDSDEIPLQYVIIKAAASSA
jgi:quercetin dioxygenase-like cupin family protein